MNQWRSFLGGVHWFFRLQNYAFPFNLSIQSSGKLPILYKKRLPILSTDNLILYGAENETRTRDPNLGKVMLYQLSYFRKLNFVIQKSERLVPRTGLEPACLSTHAPETCASTNSATWAKLSSIISKKQERKTRLELATLTLARLCSTNWAISAFHFHKLWRGGDSNSHNISVTTTSK